jgi:hypothetical protein
MSAADGSGPQYSEYDHSVQKQNTFGGSSGALSDCVRKAIARELIYDRGHRLTNSRGLYSQSHFERG